MNIHNLKRFILPYKLAVEHYGGISEKLKYLHFAKLARKKGVAGSRVERLADEYTEDWYQVKDVTSDDKEWFCQHGLAPRKVGWYGLTKENYKNYLSDFVFYNPNTYMDHSFLSLFEHKLNTYLMLAPFVEFMPIHFCYYRKGVFHPISNNFRGGIEEFMNLIKSQPVAAKSCLGGHGRGFYKFHYENGEYFMNNIRVSESALINKINLMDDYIFTEYVVPHHSFTEICGKDAFPPVIRCITVYDSEDGAQFTSSIIRLGCKEGGVVTDYHGTIYCGIRLDSGVLFKPIWRENDTTFYGIENHPDTHIHLEGLVMPNWNILRKLIVEVSNYLPWTPYLVTDIIPTEDGFKILEINSHGQVRNCEAHYPFCLNAYQRKVFNII